MHHERGEGGAGGRFTGTARVVASLCVPAAGRTSGCKGFQSLCASVGGSMLGSLVATAHRAYLRSGGAGGRHECAGIADEDGRC